MQQLKAAEDHKHVADTQREAVKQIFREPPQGTLVILADFGTADLQLPIGADAEEKGAGRVTVFSLVLQWKDDAGQLHRQFLDYTTQDHQVQLNDYHFIRAALMHLATKMGFLRGMSKVVFITDGCAKQFACVYFESVCSPVALSC